MGQRECAYGAWTRQRNVAIRGMGRREPARVLALESRQYKEGREEVQGKERQQIQQMVVEKLMAPEPRQQKVGRRQVRSDIR